MKHSGFRIGGLVICALLCFVTTQVAHADTISLSTCDASELIAAINTANGNGQANTIELKVGCTYTLTAADNRAGVSGGNGLPLITSSLTIAGNGATITEVRGQYFRIFQVAPTGFLTLQNMTLDGAKLAGSNEKGAAIYVGGGLETQKVTFNQNSAGEGAAVYAGPGSTVQLNESAFTGVFAQRNGGALVVDTNAQAVMDHSTVSLAVAKYGAAVAVVGGGTFRMVDSWFDNTRAHISGGAIYLSANTSATILRSAFTKNTSEQDGSVIWNAGSLTIANSTIETGKASTGGNGAAVASTDGFVTLVNVTLAGDRAIGGARAGILANNNVMLRNTILGMNGAPNCIGKVTDGGYNLDSGTGCAFTAKTSLSNVNPKLNGSAVNGGTTATMALQPSSPALDAGSDTVCAASPVNGIDQRGITRPQGTHCDMGAFEKNRSLTNCGNTAPPKPNLNLPDQDAVVSDTYVSFDWGAVRCADSYDVQIDPQQDSVPTLREHVTGSNLMIRLNPGQYRWRVRACAGKKCSDWTGTRTVIQDARS